MRVFKGMNQETKEPCPVCGTKEDKEVVLVGKIGTQDGNIMEAVQVHLDCLELYYDANIGIIFQKLPQGTVSEMQEGSAS